MLVSLHLLSKFPTLPGGLFAQILTPKIQLIYFDKLHQALEISVDFIRNKLLRTVWGHKIERGGCFKGFEENKTAIRKNQREKSYQL